MRIDREAFLLLAVTTLAACERADAAEQLAPEPFAAPGIAQPARMPTMQETVFEPAPPPKPISPLEAWFSALSAAQRGNVAGLCEERRVHPCAGLFRRISPNRIDEDGPNKGVGPEPDPEEKFLANLTSAQQGVAGRYCVEKNGWGPSCETPLVVALDNQPVEFAPAATAAFAFVPGKPLVSDWPTAATPWIARDLDGDGAITSGAELFGSSTELAGGTATNGFQALAALDANGDGVIDARDPAFAELVLWSDRNGDHRSSRTELQPLASVISSIPLGHTLDPRCIASGSCEGERGTLTWRDPLGVDHTGSVIDVYVRTR